MAKTQYAKPGGSGSLKATLALEAPLGNKSCRADIQPAQSARNVRHGRNKNSILFVAVVCSRILCVADAG
eukprot:4260370-Pleurochrysis_carterae.AAC.1